MYRTLDGKNRKFKKLVSKYKLDDKSLIIPKMAILKEQIEHSMDWIDEVRGILHMRRHMAAMFKGLPNFRDLRIRMLQANDKESLWQIFNEIEERYQ
jgi:tRNA-dihydrouridine synthase